MGEQARTGLRQVDPGSAGDLDAITRLHMELLDFGPMAGLGRELIREICYRVHLEEGLLQAALYEVEGRAAGFVAFTSRSITFHRASLRRHWLYTGWILTKALLRRPRRLLRLFRATRVVQGRRNEARQEQDPLGEVVCIAVQPEYTRGSFVRRTGRHLSEELVRHALERMGRAGVKRVRMLVDADNKAPLFLYHRMGARFERYDLGEEPTVQVWFNLEGEATPSHREAFAAHGQVGNA